MRAFKEIPMSEQEVLSREKLYGIGIVDAPYKLWTKMDGKIIFCPFYVTWKSMMTRCYSEKHHAQNPAYKDCEVIKEWHKLSSFKKWMEKQNWECMHLDKDIIYQDNKIYSPDKCAFVSRHLNNLIQGRRRNRTGLPVGVTKATNSERFYARHRLYGKTEFLGMFDNPADAEQAYLKAKVSGLFKVSNSQEDLRLRDGILNIALKLNRRIKHGFTRNYPR